VRAAGDASHLHSFPTRRSSDLAISRLTRSPWVNVPWCASSAPNTATASAPPTCRLVLNRPLAVPARWPGTLLSSTPVTGGITSRSEEHTSELQSRVDLVCRLLL